MPRRAALLVVVLALAACGDEGPSREDFARDANATCEERRSAIADLQQDPGGAEAYFDAFEREQAAQERL